MRSGKLTTATMFEGYWLVGDVDVDTAQRATLLSGMWLPRHREALTADTIAQRECMSFTDLWAREWAAQYLSAARAVDEFRELAAMQIDDKLRPALRAILVAKIYEAFKR